MVFDYHNFSRYSNRTQARFRHNQRLSHQIKRNRRVVYNYLLVQIQNHCQH